MIRRVSIAVLLPRFEHGAIEERYASWQTRLLLQRGEDHGRVVVYDPNAPAAAALRDLTEEHVLVLTDPLLLPSPTIGAGLRRAMEQAGAAAAVPTTNEAGEPRQRRTPPAPYLTLRELEDVFGRVASETASPSVIAWESHDPAAFLARRATLAALDVPLREALRGLDVAIAPNEYAHRWSSMRGQARHDLLSRIDPTAGRILEFGCGEAPLGQALKERQPCRVVGIELDPAAAAVAATRIDAVHRGDARTIVETLGEQFDVIIGGDIVEHLDEPWSFLEALRRVAAPGATLLLSIPNLANASLVSDLVRGRFDYVYMGLTCVGHLRFFTRQTIVDMLTIAGWTDVQLEAQDAVATPARDSLLAGLASAGIEHSRDDLLPTGYYVTARNGRGTATQ